MMLRVQLERQHEASFPASEYFRFYGLQLEHLDLARRTPSSCTPPINRGRELSRGRRFSALVILNRWRNGIACAWRCWKGDWIAHVHLDP